MGDGPQAACALLPCENRWTILNFQFQDGSDGDVGLLLLCRPGLHNHCPFLSLSLSLVDGYDDDCRCADAHSFLQCQLEPRWQSHRDVCKQGRGWMLSQFSPAIAVFSAYLSDGIETLRSLREERML